MTELTVLTDKIENNKIDWIAFACALFLAPIVVALLGFWAVIPLFALVFGPPTYLLFGAPIFAFAISQYNAKPLHLAGWGLLANILSIPAVYAFAFLYAGSFDLVTIIIGFGCVMSPLWGLALGLLYRQFHISEE